MPRPAHAFTLIELLIVVAIIAILAAIAVPNFLEAQTRSKITRVKADIRSLVTSIEAYRVDNNKYPPCGAPPEFDGAVGLSRLSTPVNYIANDALRDIFFDTKKPQLRFFGYMSRDHEDYNTVGSVRSAQWYFIMSNGPDLTLDDFTPAIAASDTGLFVNTMYDPTNGIISAGNVYRSGGQAEGPGRNLAPLVAAYDRK